MKKIMFICTGNICRSAMAEGMFKKILKDKGIKNVEVCSAGIYAETGAYATDEAIEAAKELYDVDILKHRATNIRDSKIEDMDAILCATYMHKLTITSIYPQLTDKVFTMKEYAYGKDTADKDIKDPWGYSLQVYRNCAKEIYEVLINIANKI